MIDCYVGLFFVFGLMCKQISFWGEILILKEWIEDYFYLFDQQLLILNRVELMVEWFFVEISVFEKKECKKEWVLQESELFDKEDYVQVY